MRIIWETFGISFSVKLPPNSEKGYDDINEYCDNFNQCLDLAYLWKTTLLRIDRTQFIVDRTLGKNKDKAKLNQLSNKSYKWIFAPPMF